MAADIVKHRIILFGCLLFVALTLILQETNAYHFLFIEQQQMFLFSGSYIGERLMMPGGAAFYRRVSGAVLYPALCRGGAYGVAAYRRGDAGGAYLQTDRAGFSVAFLLLPAGPVAADYAL
jgi:hypothetical protein